MLRNYKNLVYSCDVIVLITFTQVCRTHNNNKIIRYFYFCNEIQKIITLEPIRIVSYKNLSNQLVQIQLESDYMPFKMFQKQIEEC